MITISISGERVVDIFVEEVGHSTVKLTVKAREDVTIESKKGGKNEEVR